MVVSDPISNILTNHSFISPFLDESAPLIPPVIFSSIVDPMLVIAPKCFPMLSVKVLMKLFAADPTFSSVKISLKVDPILFTFFKIESKSVSPNPILNPP